MRKLSLYAYILIFLISCSNRYNNIIGKYETADYSLAEQYLKALTYRGVSMGSELDLKVDSTYVFQTCSIISKGRWEVEGDSIILKETTIRWRNDSLHEFGVNNMPPIPLEKLSLYIDSPNLKTVIIEPAKNNKTERFFLRLEKKHKER